MKHYSNNGVNIDAYDIRIGDRVTFGTNIDIQINGILSIGDDSHIGSNCHIRGNNIVIGNHLYNSGGFKAGGGGRFTPFANLTIGARNVNHACFINLARSVTLEDDVAMSFESVILTHFFWGSPLDGFPVKHAPVTLRSGTILGYGTKVMPGVTVGEDSIVGAGSVITKDLPGNEIYGGVPAKKIGDLKPLTIDEKKEFVSGVIDEYREIAKFHGYDITLVLRYPNIEFEGCSLNVISLQIKGEESYLTDTLRDHLRRYGLKIYTSRQFRSFDAKQ